MTPLANNILRLNKMKIAARREPACCFFLAGGSEENVDTRLSRCSVFAEFSVNHIVFMMATLNIKNEQTQALGSLNLSRHDIQTKLCIAS